MQVTLDRKRVVRAISTAVQRGASEPLKKRPDGQVHHWRTKYAGNCSKPVLVQQTGRRLTRGTKSVHAVEMTGAGVMLHELEVPCRLCENCLRRRASHWRLRAMSEFRLAEVNFRRTWFGTLTLSPEQHSRVAMACRTQFARNGDDWDTLSTKGQFAARHALISREITLYLNRIRKVTNFDGMRFLCVAEAHKTGLPHYHMLVHEGETTPIRYDHLQDKWRIGFSNWKLVKDMVREDGTVIPAIRVAGYVTKYLAKSSMARVRASLDYGQTSSDIGSKGTVTPLIPLRPAASRDRAVGTDQKGP